MEKALAEWINQTKQSNQEVTSSIVTRKALLLASELEIDDFKASENWLVGFRKRFNFSSDYTKLQVDGKKKTRQSLSYAKKLAIIEMHRTTNMSSSELSREFGIPKSTIQKTIKRADTIVNFLTENPNLLHRKNARTGDEPRFVNLIYLSRVLNSISLKVGESFSRMD